MYCFPFLFFKNTNFQTELSNGFSQEAREGAPDGGLWERTGRGLLQSTLGKDHSYLPAPGCGPEPGVACTSPPPPESRGCNPPESACFHCPLAFLSLDLSVNKCLHIVHMANVFDTRCKESRNQCVQRITWYLESRFVFPLADFEVRSTQMGCETSNCHQRPFSLRENLSVFLLKQVKE